MVNYSLNQAIKISSFKADSKVRKAFSSSLLLSLPDSYSQLLMLLHPGHGQRTPLPPPNGTVLGPRAHAYLPMPTPTTLVNAINARRSCAEVSVNLPFKRCNSVGA